MTMRRDDIAEDLRRFNEERKQQFGRGPEPDRRLPLPYTGIGGDIAPPGQDDQRDWE